MNSESKNKQIKRKKRAIRIRKKLKGTALRPRLSVMKSNKHIYAQLINDETGTTLLGLGSMSKKLKESGKGKSKEMAKQLGQMIAEEAKQKNIHAVVFDRGRYRFHGIIKQLANSAREAGLQF